MLQKLGRLEMLHRGIHRASGWLAGQTLKINIVIDDLIEFMLECP